MDRLTYLCNGEYRVNEHGAEYSGQSIDRLAAYEDTGLEPDEIETLSHRLDENIGACNVWMERYYDLLAKQNNATTRHIGELLRAESEGRLLVLPCKVGDTVYTAQRGVISELSVDHFELYNVGIWVSWHLMSGIYGNFRMDGFPASDIGKTVFLTRAAAEEALAKERDADG